MSPEEEKGYPINVNSLESRCNTRIDGVIIRLMITISKMVQDGYRYFVEEVEDGVTVFEIIEGVHRATEYVLHYLGGESFSLVTKNWHNEEHISRGVIQRGGGRAPVGVRQGAIISGSIVK